MRISENHLCRGGNEIMEMNELLKYWIRDINIVLRIKFWETCILKKNERKLKKKTEKKTETSKMVK